MIRPCLLFFGFLSGLAAAQAQADSRFSAGVEGFHDQYQEPDLQVGPSTVTTVRVSTIYGSVTAGYEHANHGFFSAIDGRYSQGREDYKSISGTHNGEPSLESDVRLRTGLDLQMWHGHLMPYIGIGWRYYFDQGKGLVSSDGALFYDRHISQFYIPLGATFRFTSGDWTFSPNAEFDILADGTVNTHLAPIGGGANATNSQGFGSGIGLRAEFMAGQQYKYLGWEAGPFVRYWNISDSNAVDGGIEPHNTRVQLGAALRVNFY